MVSDPPFRLRSRMPSYNLSLFPETFLRALFAIGVLLGPACSDEDAALDVNDDADAALDVDAGEEKDAAASVPVDCPVIRDCDIRQALCQSEVYKATACANGFSSKGRPEVMIITTAQYEAMPQTTQVTNAYVRWSVALDLLGLVAPLEMTADANKPKAVDRGRRCVQYDASRRHVCELPTREPALQRQRQRSADLRSEQSRGAGDVGRRQRLRQRKRLAGRRFTGRSDDDGHVATLLNAQRRRSKRSPARHVGTIRDYGTATMLSVSE